MSFNLATILEESTKRNPDKVAIILDDFKMTYKQLDEAANQVANSLRTAGIKPGERVGMMLPNVPHFPMIYFGILKAGCVAVPMNVLLKAPEIEYYLSDSEASTFFYWDMFQAEALKGAEAVPSVKNRIHVTMMGGEAPAGTTEIYKYLEGQPKEFD